MDVNVSTTIAGNLTDDLALRYTPAGLAVADFTVAATARVRDRETGGFKDGQTTFLRCSAWRAVAENTAESLRKGDRVVVVGRLRQSGYETDDGQRRTGYEVDVDELGASLRYASATLARRARRQSEPEPAD
jgi:single-strand DNA-binding protein